MTMRLSNFWAAAAALALATTPILAGCTGTPEAKVATVQPGDMPSGASWTGVYFSELYGHLHVVQDGTGITAKWIRPVKDRWGEMHGTATGDVIKFTWTEHTIGSVGPKAAKTGHGYFKYKRPSGDNVDDTIAGEIGEGQDEVGLSWEAVKQRNMSPDLDSIGGSGAGDIGGGDWDGDNKDKGAPEAPEAPPPP